MKMKLPSNFDKLSWELKCAKVSEMPTRRLHSAYNPQPKRKKNLTPSTHCNAYSIEFKRQVITLGYIIDQYIIGEYIFERYILHESR